MERDLGTITERSDPCSNIHAEMSQLLCTDLIPPHRCQGSRKTRNVA